MDETYYESAAGVTISKARTVQELKSHGFNTKSSLTEFFTECGVADSYDAQTVLAWLGY